MNTTPEAEGDEPQIPSLQEARSCLSACLADLEKSAYAIGYDAGFLAGWDAAVRRVAALSAEKPEPNVPKTLVDPEISAKEIVLRIIRENPGLRGYEIVRAAVRFGTPINERSVRTALHRLKASPAVIRKNGDGKWFVVESSDQRTE